MNIKQFRFGESNLGYLLWSGTDAAAVDGGAPEQILEFCRDEGLGLRYVVNTHEHWDHVPGNKILLGESEAAHIDPAGMCRLKVLPLGEEQFEAFPTPGHSDDSIVFYFKNGKDDCLLTGDTLFNGTVGNCYTGNYELYFESLQKVLRFPPQTKIYAGHDIFEYTTGVMDRIDPDNPYLADYKRLYSDKLLVTTIEQELRVNPFIRFNDPSLDAYREGLDMPLETDFQRWRAMMSAH